MSIMYKPKPGTRAYMTASEDTIRQATDDYGQGVSEHEVCKTYRIPRKHISKQTAKFALKKRSGCIYMTIK